VLAGGVRRELVQPSGRGHALLDEARMVLREVADRGFVPPPDLAVVDVAARRFPARGLGQQRPEQRRLADAVAPDEDDLLAALDDGREAVDDRRAVVALADVAELERHPARRPAQLAPAVGAVEVRARELGRLQPLDFLDARLHLARARARREARDELLELRDLLFALRVLR